jgi:AbrB-like transcriptional regulator
VYIDPEHEKSTKISTNMTTSAKLTGKALLRKVKELSSLPKRETAKQCGYYSENNGSIRVDLTGFYDAVLSAKGVDLDPGQNQDGRGKAATYKATVHKNGQLLIGATYTKSMGLKEGDEFEIKLGYKHIHLVQISS